ncbi:MAG: MFS transporter [Rhodothermales bacterium]
MRTAGLEPRLFAALMIGVFMGALDLTIVAPALADIGASLEVSPAAVVLAFSIYAAFYAVSVPLMSKLADSWGYAYIYRISLLLFVAGSALAALAPSIAVLVIARTVQGIGGGGLFPVAQAIIGIQLPDERQGRVLGIMVGVFALGGILGPNIGGFFAQQLSWHWIFWINVPLGLIAALMVRRIDGLEKQKKERIDWAGTLLVAVCLGSLVLWLESMRHVTLLSLHSLGLFALMLGSAVAFIRLERDLENPIIDLSFVGSARIAPLLLVSLLVGYSLLAGVVFAPLYAQIAFGATTLASGAVLNAAAVGLGISSYLAGHLTRHSVSSRLIVVGMILTSAGLGFMILFREAVWGLLGGLVLLGSGLGLNQGPLSHMGLRLAPSDKQGQISGLIAITRSIGGAAGITLAGVLLSRAVEDLTGASDFHVNMEEIWGGGQGLESLDRMTPAGAEAVRSAIVDGLVHGWYAALAAALVGTVIALFLRENKT